MSQTSAAKPVVKEDEIDLLELLKSLLANWKTILKWCGIAAVAGLVIAFSLPKEYTVGAKLSPELTSKNSAGNLSSLASMAGINLNLNSTSDAVYPDLYPDIVSSTPFVVELFNLPVSFTDKKGNSVETTFYDYLEEYTSSPWWSAVLGAPGKAISWFIGLFQGKEEEADNSLASLNPSALTYEQEKKYKSVCEMISVSVDSETSVVSTSVTTQNPDVSYQVSCALLENLKDYVTDYRTEKARHDEKYTQEVYDHARDEYYTAQKAYAEYADRNKGIILQSVRIESERLQSEMNLAYNLYTSCAQQLQAAKAKVLQETPVYITLEPPSVPSRKSAPSKAMILVVFVFLGGCCAALWVLWGKDTLAKLKE